MHQGLQKLKRTRASYTNNVEPMCRNYKSKGALHTKKKEKPMHNNYTHTGAFVLYECIGVGWLRVHSCILTIKASRKKPPLQPTPTQFVLVIWNIY